MIYRIGQFACRILLSGVFFASIQGKENIPANGPVIICSNHKSNFDPPLLGSYIKRPLRFMAKEELFEKKGFGTLIKNLGAFPVKRGAGDRASLRTALAVLNQGDMLLLFPEGNRSKTDEIGEGLAGAGFFALKSDAVVIPAYVKGKYKPFKKIELTYGQAVPLDDLREEKASARQVTDRIMDHIKQLKEEQNSN
ncbi:1-acyl-sn-glycerol-3-phosphate acyltransferase [Geomicrobium sp. JCM 19039]|uniref:lysophospholipid acyltransferase family protein n=1 Tax=Geomicrobium sp. JCM 19039 TaxID=1460636 RepID=UPI00045F4832|nr:lysophospholipid acyltransferase family protein [Geomicrobium sp. JCM 19039]GAK11243.1 1-acyl-SN-glycerol-3-phosphate acyltransferase [Geomicrobium sp. JCM 19039]